MGNFFLKALAVLCLIPCSIGAACAKEAAVPVERQDISVKLEPERHLLIGKTVLMYPAGTRSVLLRLSESASIDSVEVDGKAASFSLQSMPMT